MKKLLFICVAFLLTVGIAVGQNKKVTSVTIDTIQGAETIYMNLNTSGVNTTDGVLVFQALMTQTGGTSDGQVYLEFSVDGTSWVRYSGAYKDNEFVKLYASDTTKLPKDGVTFTITNAGVFGGVLTSMPYAYYRLACVGTSGDTTKVTVKYAFTKR